MPSTIVQYEKPGMKVRRTEVRAFADSLVAGLAGGREFACLIATPETLQRLNRDFRRKDESTDVLSFPSTMPAGSLGDLAISIEHARQQARERGHSMEEELGILMLHGLLHLLGMDHETDKGEMHRTETRWRKKLGLPDSLIARASTKQPPNSKPKSKRA